MAREEFQIGDLTVVIGDNDGYDGHRAGYAWSTLEGKFTAVLGVPLATGPQNAVKVSIVADAKKKA